MTTFLVTYGTGEGQTAKVAAYIGSALAKRGHDVTTAHVSDVSDDDVAGFDAILIGGPVNNRRHRPEVVEFVERNRETLADRPSGFFQLSFASILPWRWARGGAMEYVDAFVERTGWHPDRVGLFAGAVRYSQYDRLTRTIFRLVSAATTGDTDTSRDYEYTDWGEVERFAIDFADLVEARREREPSPTGRLRAAVAGIDRRRAVVLGLLGVGLGGAAYWIAGGRALLVAGSRSSALDPGRGGSRPT